jgi:Holliday junction resolvase-like predicted endonuclease
MSAEPLPAPSGAETSNRALQHAREHLERLGYQLLDEPKDRRTGTRFVAAFSASARELVFCELRAERLDALERPAGGLQRKRLRRAALAWLAVNTGVHADSLRFDRLTVFVGHDGAPVGLTHEPQAF